MPLEHVTVIGAGAWGTALAQAAALAGRQIMLCGREPAVAEEINTWHSNSVHLPGIELSPNIMGAANYAAAIVADLIVMAVPAQATRSVLEGIGPEELTNIPVVLTAKGLETTTLKRQSEILHDIAPDAIPYVLSGPSFAADVAAGRPTAVTLAGDDAQSTSDIAAALAGPTFRPYAADDRIGVELAGALKNIYAIACGAVDGAGLGASARSALIARAFAELNRLVVRMGGSASTLTGLAGLGDLTLTCTSPQSRNYRYGAALGKGTSPDPASLAEGVATAPVALSIARKAEIDVPLIEAVNLLLTGTASIASIVSGLMSRPLKREDT
jgi:glycerol-3-phosphate dehydrogenase (NAD(P)+)